MSDQKAPRSTLFYIRALTTAPLMALAALVALKSLRGGMFSGGWQFAWLIFGLTVLPLLSYPLQRFIPPFKNQGRAGQRTVAMILAVLGYAVCMAVCAASNASRDVWFLCLQYLLCGVVILAVNKGFHRKISGHMCGIVGPCMVLTRMGLWASLIIGGALATLVGAVSVKMGRHTPVQLVGGCIAPICVWCVLSLMFIIL